MINVALEKMNCGRLKNEALDIDIMHRKLLDINNKEFSLDELCTIYKIPLNTIDNVYLPYFNDIKKATETLEKLSITIRPQKKNIGAILTAKRLISFCVPIFSLIRTLLPFKY
jgi:hypothetical protein